ncbi:hypothetical protein NP233_g8339 [Leucocoprinus birnbaumii]|uniref:Phosphoglycerate mutase-like protein n=1 Tax=Leucocoprinus birnbaumii TaxID=56174 RepID=A0AAD5YN90_9AGAR|nr:hypothetical protein NP233_g8339 [Leucocoprinus birnbaumii]
MSHHRLAPVFAKKIWTTSQKWNATGKLSFLNEWTYKLGADLLTTFGRQQLFELGATMRIKYGFLLKNFTKANEVPVFRTLSPSHMIASAMNFALGFFGWPLDGQYQQSIMIEEIGFNTSLAAKLTCSNCKNKDKQGRSKWYSSRWKNIYLQNARERLAKDIPGFDLTIKDVYNMQEMCAYETVGLGYSKFCELFTEDEWEGFDYALDLRFWYDYGFGAPLARIQGIGWVQELVARLTHEPVITHNTSTNAILDSNPITFPLNHSLYVDVSHKTVMLSIMTALNLTSFAEEGPLPYTHILKTRKFRSSEIIAFGSSIQFQLLECTSLDGPQIRIIINDGVVPLTGIRGCPAKADGMCPVAVFVEAMRELIRDADWTWDCNGDWEVPPGDQWHTTTGTPPERAGHSQFY